MKRNVSAALRETVLWRDGWVCRICEEELKEDQWHCDHIVPLWSGGSNEQSNLQAICANCHAGKTAKETRERNLKRKRAKEELIEKEIKGGKFKNKKQR